MTRWSNKRFCLAFAALCGLAPAALAQEPETEPEIVVTAPIEGARIESLQGAAILGRDDIVEDLQGGLGDTLDSQLGVSTTFFGAGASRPIVRGLGEDRVRVLQNGIGAIDASTASPDHAVTADGLDAERIEVLRGAAALAYGGNAIGGVVNVIDQSIPTRAIDGASFDGFAAVSSVDEGVQGAADLGLGRGALALRLSASARDSDAYETPLGQALSQWTVHRAFSLGAGAVGGWGFAGLAAKQTENEYGLTPESPAEPGGRIEMAQTRLEARGDWRVDWGPFDRFDVSAQQADYEHTEFEGDGAPGTRFLSDGFEARVELHHGDERHQGAMGFQVIDVELEARGDEAFIGASQTRDIGAFLIERYDLGRWGLEGGLRYERREISNVDFGARTFDNWSGAAGVFFRPAQHWFLGATVAHSQRAPTAVELFSDGPHLATANYEIGDSALDPESALSFEVSARFDDGPVRFELNLFHVAFADYIALVERGDVWWSDEATASDGFAPDASDPGIPAGATILPVFQFVQRDARFAGGEASVAADLFEIGGFSVRGEIAFDAVRATFDGGGHPPRIPPRTLTLGLEAENAHWTAHMEIADIGDQRELAPFETPTDGYTLLGAGLAFRPFGDRRIVFRLDGRNLTDEEARVHTSFLKDELPLPGRNLRFSVLASF